MLYTALTLLVLAATVAIAGFVTARSWQYRPTRLFVYLSAAILVVLGSSILRDMAPDPTAAYPYLSALVVGVSLYQTLLNLLLAALFMPEWWEERRPIIWINAPYLLITLFIAADLFGRFGILATGSRFEDVYRLNYTGVNQTILALSLVGSLVNLAILGFALPKRRYHHQRPAIVALMVASALTLALGPFTGSFTGIVRLGTLLQVLPIIAALGYTVLGTELFSQTRAALDQALASLSDAVSVVDNDGIILFANPKAVSLGLPAGGAFADRLQAAVDHPDQAAALISSSAQQPAAVAAELTFASYQIELSLTPVYDKGARRGTLLIGRDVTDLSRRTAQLMRERADLAEALRQVEAEQRQRAQLAETVRALSLPLIPVLPGVIVLPLIGDFTDQRIGEFITILLRGIEREQARTVLIDITGLALLDTQGAQGLITGVRAAALLGARSVLVGVRPEVAQSLVALGVNLDEIQAAPTLQQAIAALLARNPHNLVA